MPRCRSLSKPHDPDLSRMLIVFIATGLAFMLLPGTLVGVVTLLKISAAHASRAADAGWIQAHGHAQVFGWLGTFILGIGYYAIPRLRLSPFSRIAAWVSYGFWTAGVAIHWAVGTWPPAQWRVPFAASAVMELVAVLVFAIAVYLAPPRAHDESWRASILVITAAGWAFVAAVALTAVASISVARYAKTPAFGFDFDQRYLVMITWGFIVPFIWGFASRWLPPLLALRKMRKTWLVPTLAVLFSGVILALAGFLAMSAALLLVATLMFAIALRIFEPSQRDPKVRGVSAATPVLIRIAFGWSVIAAVIAIVSALHRLPNGYAGASRHALTVGFFSATVFTIGPRILPAFFNVRRLWSTGVMSASLILLNIGCVLRVGSQILAYEGISAIAWQTLPLSAVLEMLAVTLFAFNMVMTLTTGSPLEVYLESLQQREA